MIAGQVRTIRLSGAEAALWCVAALGATALSAYMLSGVRLGNDSYQYLSTAENVLAGRGITSSIVHFDVQYGAGRLPAPQTTFPPGYPLAVAAISLALDDVVRSGLVVSLLATGVAVLAVLAAARALELSATATRLVAFCFLTNAATLAFATSVLTEMLFTAVTMTALACLMTAERAPTPGRRTGWLAAGAVLGGVSYWIRYAGIFLVATVVLYALWRLTTRRRARDAWESTAIVGVSGVFVVAGMVRNTWLTGTIRGGNEKMVDRGLGSALERLANAAYHLAVGDETLRADLVPPGPLETTLFASAVAVIALIGWHTAGPGRGILRRSLTPLVGLPLTYGAVYTAGMVCLGTVTVITLGPRMLYPVLPVGLLLVGLLLTVVGRELRVPRAPAAFTAVLVVLAAALAAVNVRSLVRERPERRHDVVAARLAMPTRGGDSLASRIEREVAGDTPVAAMDGQATAWVVRRPTLSLASLEYSARPWTEDRLRETAARFGARFMIVYREGDVARRLGAESTFVADLLRGVSPSWMTLVAENGAAALYRMSPGPASAATGLRTPSPHPPRP